MEHLLRTSWINAVTIMIVTLALVMSAEAGELRGTVQSVSGEVVTIRCAGGVSPNPGDPVKIGFEAPGAGFIGLEGSWKVSLVGPGGEIQATPVPGAHGSPQVGYLALITTAAATSPPIRGARQGQGTLPTGQDRSGLPVFAQGPWMGLGLQRTEDNATSGVPIREIHPGGAAAQAGLKAGDVILAINRVPTPSSQALNLVIRDTRVGDVLKLRLLRLPDVIERSISPELPSLDSPVVQAKIGYDFLHGIGVVQNERKGFEWLERAAAGGFGNANKIMDEYRGQSTAGRSTSKQESTRNQATGVFIAGNEEGKRPAWFILEAEIFNTVTALGAPVRDLPPDIWPQRNNLSSPEQAFRSLQTIGGGWLLWVEVNIHWGHLGFAKDRVRVQCLDPNGQLKWEEDASNVFADSADHSIQILTQKIAKKLRKKRGKACLRP